MDSFLNILKTLLTISSLSQSAMETQHDQELKDLRTNYQTEMSEIKSKYEQEIFTLKESITLVCIDIASWQQIHSV